MPRFGPARALTRATFRSYRNALRQAYRANPALVASAVLVSGIVLLFITVFQLQAVLPFLSDSTLGQLTEDQVDSVGRASLTGLAAAAWGIAMIFETVGFQSAGLLTLATSRGIGPANRAIGQTAPVLCCASLLALLLIGPASYAGLYRSLIVHGHSSRAAAVLLAAVVVLCVAAVAACSAVAVPAAVALVLRRERRSPEVRGAGAAVTGGHLITGISLVLAGNTNGLYVVAPPLLVGGGLPRSGPAAALAVLVSLAWCVLCLALVAGQRESLARSSGVNLRLSWLRLTSTQASVEARQMFRDGTGLSAIAISLAGAVVLAVFFRTHHLDDVFARFVLLGLVGVSSLAPCVAAFRAATHGWLYVVRPGAYLQWYRDAAVGMVAATTLVTIACRLLSTLPFAAGSDLVLLCVSISGSVIGLVCGVLVNRPGVSAESKGGLYGGGLLAAGVLLLTLWPTTKYALFDSSATTMAYLLVVTLLVALAGDVLVRLRSRPGVPADARA